MSVAIIINPVAGGSRGSLAPERRAALARQALDRRRIAGRVELTAAAGHGRELARRAVDEGCDLVVAWGGDGTVNEVASQLLGTSTALGVVRAGSGNGLARELGIPKHPERALDIALGARERVLDVGELEGRAFLNVAGIGFDAAMAVEFNRLGGERRGPVRYALQVLRAALGYEGAHYEIEADGRRIEADALLVAMANLAQYGTNAVIAPGAKPDDGLLDVVVIEERGALGRIGLAPRIFDRTIDKAPGVTIVRAAHVVVRGAGPILFHVDGETHTAGASVEARIHRAVLRVKVA